MNCAFVFLSSLLYLAAVEYREVNSLALDDLDFARSTIQSVANSITSKAPTVSGSRLKSIKSTHGSKGAKGWFVSRRIVTGKGIKKTKVVTTKVTTTKVATSKPRNLNKFNEVMDQVERAMAQAELSRKTAKLADLRKDITNAVNKGNVRFARKALGIAFYTATKATKGRGKRSTGLDAKKFLDDIKKDLGDDKFSDFLALQGEVTLMFALDVTGSMGDEIKSSKEIIKEISKKDRSEPVDYILSTFSDPVEVGTTEYFADDQVNEFVKHVDSITATGGGDCPEYSFDGMINALYEDPRWGSPLYVFTDAVPKDADEDNKETLRVLAEDLGVTVNFFAGTNVCTRGTSFKEEDFKEVVEAFGGQYLKLNAAELRKMASFTGSSLEGTSAVVSGKSKSARRKRRATTNIGIPIDDTVTKLVVTITTLGSPHGVQLYTPTGGVQTAGKTVVTRVVVFSVDSPSRGLWKLVIPSSVGKYEYSAKVISPENIDFEHHFSKLERGKLVHLRNPLAGQNAQVSLTVSGASKIEKSSLLLDIIDVSGKTLVANKKLTEAGKSGIRFTVQFVPPNTAFRLLLKGKTKAGKSFQRISRHVDSSKALVVKEYYTSRHYTMPKKGTTNILFYLFNGLKQSKKYTVSFRTKKGYTASLPGRQSTLVRGSSKKYLRAQVKYTGGVEGKVGETLNVVIIVKGQDGSFITSEVVPLMIIE